MEIFTKSFTSLFREEKIQYNELVTKELIGRLRDGAVWHLDIVSVTGRMNLRLQ